MQALPAGGAMAALAVPEDRVASRLAAESPGVAVAALNRPEQTVVSGPEDEVVALMRAFEADGVRAARLDVSHAFHSPLMDPMLEPFAEVAASISYRRPDLPLVSNVTGALAGPEIAEPAYWVGHARAPVRFLDGIRTALAEGAKTCVEVGPAPILSALGARCSAGDVAWLPSLRPGRDDWHTLLSSLGAAWMRGADVDWRQVLHPFEGTRLPLPTYPFQRERHWVAEARPATPGGHEPLSGSRLDLPGTEVHRVLSVGVTHQPYLADHLVFGRLVVPGAFWLAVALGVAADEWSADSVTLEDVRFVRPLVLEGSVKLHVVLAPGPETTRFTISSRGAGPGRREPFVTHAQGLMRRGASSPAAGSDALAQARAACPKPLEVDDLYDGLARLHVELGPAWRWTKRSSVGEGEATARLEAPVGLPDADTGPHPAFLDNVLATGLAPQVRQAEGETTPRLPFSIDRLRWYGPAAGPVWCHGIHRSSRDDASRFDLAAWREDGQPLLEVEGFTARRAPQAVFLRLAGALPASPLLRMAWQPVETGPPEAGGPRGRWAVRSPSEPVEAALREALAGAGAKPVDSGPLDGVVLVFEEGEEALGAFAATRRVVDLAREVLAETSAPAVVVVTRGAQAVLDGEVPDLATSSVWGAGRVWRSERWQDDVRLIDVSPALDPSELAETVLPYLAAAADPELALRRGSAYRPRLVRLGSGEETPPDLAGSSALITGGLGALGLHLAAHLVTRHRVARLLLVGRHPPDPDAERAIESLRAGGAGVTAAQADVADAAQLAASLEQLEGDPPLRAVFHAAGLLDDAPLADQTPDRLERVLAPKVAGAWNLHEQTAHLDLDLFVLFSSVSGLLGTPGQAGYAAANAFLDALARWRRSTGRSAQSLCWGPWSGGGMASRMSRTLRDQLSGQGIHPVEPSEALALTDEALATDLAEVVILPLDPVAMGRALPEAAVPAPLRSLVDRPPPLASSRASTSTTGWLDELKGLPRAERLAALVARLGQEAARAMAVPDASEVPPDVPLTELGLDSLTAVELAGTLSAALGREVAIRSLFEHPTLGSLAEHLLAEALPTGPSGDVAPFYTNVATIDRRATLPTGPLSSGQRRLWFLDRLAPRKELYHVHIALRARGSVSLPAARAALAALIERHEVLRTCFFAIDGEPRQQVFEPWAPALEPLDLSTLPRAERTARLRAERDRQMRDPFDLAREPPIRFDIVRLGPADHVLSITQHHLVTDGHSLNLLVAELAALYGAFATDRPSPLPPVRRRYIDLAEQEARARQEGRFDGDLDYWHLRLADLPTLRLPGERSSPSRRTWAGDVVPLTLSSTLTADLVRLGREHGATPFMTVAAALAATLFRSTDQTDLALGTVHANRPDHPDVLGLFVNTVVLRTDLSGQPSFSELLGRTAATVFEALEHGHVPFEDVVRRVEGERRGEDNPLFRVCVVQESRIEPSGAAGGLTFEPLMDSWDGAVPGTAKFDLTLVFALVDGRLEGSLEYATERLDRGSVERLATHLRRLAERAVAHPLRPVPDLELLDGDEHRRIVEWSGAGTQLADSGCVHDRFEQTVLRCPRAVALRDGEQTLTFDELDRRADRLAHRLHAHGVGPERLVGIHADRSFELVAGLLGILKAGGAYLPLDPDDPPARLELLLEDADPALVLTREHLRDRLPAGGRPQLLLDGREASAESPIGLPRRAGPDSLAYVVYTSGSTGRPKGVQVTHANLGRYLRWKLRAFPPQAGDRLLHKTSLGFDSSAGEVWYPLLAGSELVMARPGGQGDVRYLIETIEGEGITILKAVPSLWRLLLAAGGLERCTSLRLLLSAGEPLPTGLARGLVEATGARVVNLYGPAEATVSATRCDYDPARHRGALVPIGRGIDGVSTWVLDDAQRPAPVGVAGELCLGGSGVARGYLARPRLTARRFVPDPFAAADGARMYRTGDRARWSDDGELEFLGRQDRQVQVHGRRVELGEIEAVLSGLPGVDACAVDLRGSGPEGPVLTAWVEAAADPETLRDGLGARLPGAMVPARFVRVPTLPRLPSGKVDRAVLPAPAPSARERPSALTATERALAGIWEAALDVSSVDATTSFFLQGGDSLLAVRVMLDVERAFPGRARLGDLFEHPTITRLAGCIVGRDAPAEEEDPAVRERRLRRRIRLPQDIVPDPTQQALTPPRDVLLTGATGFVGAHLLVDLLDAVEGTVACLVRADSAEDARRRLEAALREHGTWRDDVPSRTAALPGDLARRDLGLDGPTLDGLAGRLDTVVHCGAHVHHAHGYEALQATNVGGTVEVLRLACRGRPKAVHFVSTMDVLPPTRSGYAQTKWVAEGTLALARERGVGVTVYRPGLVLGHSVSGRVPTAGYWAPLLLRACVRLGALPSEALFALPAVPVDWVSRTLVTLAQRQEAAGGIHHLTHPDTLTRAEVRDALAERGYVLEPLPYPDWLDALERTLSTAPELAGLRAVLPARVDGAGADPHPPNEEVHAALAAARRELPAAAQLLGRTLDYLVDSGFLPRPL